MSLLISGINLPNDKPVTLFITSNRNVYLERVEGVLLSGKAVLIPPHGRLIDADALKRELVLDYAYAAANMVDNAPTIIPASEEGEA